jgi:E3 ubiquitin-protein ligase HERC4
MEPFRVIACGYAHTLAASDVDGSVYGFGWNAHSQVIGDSTASDCLLPAVCLKSKGVVKLSCGFAHSAAITLNGSLFIWGKFK